MADVAELTYELLKRVHADISDMKREQASMRMRLSSLEQHHATIAGDMAQIRIELDDIRGDVTLIKRRLDLVEA